MFKCLIYHCHFNIPDSQDESFQETMLRDERRLDLLQAAGTKGKKAIQTFWLQNVICCLLAFVAALAGEAALMVEPVRMKAS